ncbi:hypothetical protein DV738_g2999, partial [Chaetothyriales sp. CBS 135597]
MSTMCSIYFSIWILFNIYVRGVDARVTPVSHITAPASQTTKTIAFSSAVKIEASVAWESKQRASTAALPIPTNIAHIPEYAAVRLLAPAMPAIQQGVEFTDVDRLVADVVPPAANASSTGAEKPPADDGSALRVMIVGDSMTQGQEGDWTWRYRMWQWFKEHEIAVRFVGPYKGTIAPPPPHAPEPPPLYGASPPPPGPPDDSGGYAEDVDPEFLSNSNHFSVWGRAAATDKGLIQEVLEQYPADLILLMLGFNDLGWFYSDAHGLVESIETLITNARAANPHIKFALANVPQRSEMGRPDLVDNTNLYNKLLPPLIEKVTSKKSPVFLVELERHYKCNPQGCPAAYDGLHPNGWGDFQIAHAFSETLVNDFKLGSRPLKVPPQHHESVTRKLAIPANFKVFPSPQGVTATWDKSYGAYSYELRVSINGGGPGFSGSATQFNRWDSHWPLEGWTYSVSVRACAGEHIKTDYTETLSADAKPELAPPPCNIHAEATEKGLVVTWDPPTGPYTDSIVEYNILYWEHNPKGPGWIASAAFTESPGVIPDLEPDKEYRIAMLTWNENGEGLPFHVEESVAGKVKPAVADPSYYIWTPYFEEKEKIKFRVQHEKEDADLGPGVIDVSPQKLPAAGGATTAPARSGSNAG